MAHQRHTFLIENNLLEGERCYRNGIQADRSDAICYSNVGYALSELGRSADSLYMLLTPRYAIQQRLEFAGIDMERVVFFGGIPR